MGSYRRRGYGYGFLASRKRSRRRSIPMAEQGSFWETLMVGTGDGPQAERKQKVLRYVIHRLKKGEASLREVLQEEYVRRNCTELEIEQILLDPELVHAARGHMEQSFHSGELDPVGGGR
jgi:hypothetical protein